MSSIVFWRRNKAFFSLAIQQNLEYRFNYALDCFVQPIVAAMIELTLWLAVFRGASFVTLGGYNLNDYLAYAFWGAFVARIATTWTYEYKMIAEIESGSLNSLLVRPTSFFEAYLSQFLGYKLTTIVGSLWVPVAFCEVLGFPILYERLPGMMLTVLLYLIFVQTLSFIIATLAFHLTRVGSFTMAKNLALWVFSGELFPLDLLPEPFRTVIIAAPFSNAVYIPVGYITGRVSVEMWAQGLLSVVIGIACLSVVALLSWKKGVRAYVGTGA